MGGKVPNYWQVSAGYEGREYSKYFIKYGLAFFDPDKVPSEPAVKEGDIFLIKRGISEVISVGIVKESVKKSKETGQKDWLRDFDGWDLGAYCSVAWHEVPKESRKIKGLTIGTIKKIWIGDLINFAENIIKSQPQLTHDEIEPVPTKEITDDEILIKLVDNGLSPNSANSLTEAFRKIRLLADYYYRIIPWKEVREHETRTFLIIPLLLALGWSEQQIKIEVPVGGGGRADIVCYDKPYKGGDKIGNDKENCRIILESKGFSQGLEYASGQAKSYAENFPKCRFIVVSNGYCYKIYEKINNKFTTEIVSAYINILKPRDKYPLDPKEGNGSIKALLSLLP